MALLPGGVVMRRVAIACALWAVALGAACNGLLGNSEHAVAGDASTDASGSDTSTGRDSGKDHMVPEAGSDTSTRGTDSGIHPEQSCAAVGPGRTNCGASSGGGGDGGDAGDGGHDDGSAGESCCTSLPVSGGKFDRSFDGVTFDDATHTATVSSFNLDKYEITVGRFRKFVTAVVGGWLPPQGSGKHTYLKSGGLTSTSGGTEGGWDATGWNVNLSTSLSDWDNNLTCGATYWTWTSSPGTSENNPINCETWYEAYAFCIWDGGFLPSEAEWNYAAAGGGGASGQRVYPWSIPSTDQTIDCAHTNYLTPEGGICVPSSGTNNVGSESPVGDGFFHQADMAGNVWEWTLDASNAKSPVTSYVSPCNDCAFTSGPLRVFRGGSFVDDAPTLVTSFRRSDAPSLRASFVGARCARAP